MDNFFNFHIDSAKDLDANLDVFNRLFLNLANCKMVFSYVHNDVILLNSLVDVYKEVKNAIKYDRDELTINIVVNSLRARDLELQSEPKNEGSNVRGKTTTRNFAHCFNKIKSMSSSRSKSKLAT